MLSKCSECKSNAVRLQFDCCPNNACRKVSRLLFECSQNAHRMAAECGSSIQECKQNPAGMLRMHFECTWNVTRNVISISRIRPDYFLIRYKMLPNLAFSSRSLSQHNRYMETLDAVDLLQIAVLQQDLVEIDVGEKRKMTRRRENIRSVHGWQRRGEHYARLIEKLRVEDPLPQHGACHVYELVQRTRDIPTGFEVANCHVDSPSNETRMFRMLIECRKTI